MPEPSKTISFSGLTIRRKGEQKFYAPSRDLCNIMNYMLQAAANTAWLLEGKSTPDDQVKHAAAVIEALHKAVEGLRGAKPTDEQICTILHEMLRKMEPIDPKTRATFNEAFFVQVLARYMVGVREITSDKELCDIESVALCNAAGIVAMLSPELAEKVKAELRDKGAWPQALDFPVTVFLDGGIGLVTD